MSEFGAVIKHLRNEKGWSQGQLAVYSETSQPTVNQIETGKRNPSTETLVKLARALGVEVADLFPKGQAPLPDFESERRETTADELLEDFRRQVEQDAKEVRRALASEGIRQPARFSRHYNDALEKLSGRLPVDLVGPFADICQGFAWQEQEIIQLREALRQRDQKIAQLEEENAQLREARVRLKEEVRRDAERTTKTA